MQASPLRRDSGDGIICDETQGGKGGNRTPLLSSPLTSFPRGSKDGRAW